MKKGRTRSGISREEAARELSTLAGQVADGVFTREGVEIRLPEKFRFQWEVKQKGDRVVLELSIKGEIRKANRQYGKKKGRGERKRPYEAKKLKKALAGQWKELKRCIKDRSVPGNNGDLLALLSRYGDLADARWKDAWDECHRQLLLLIEQLEKGEFDQAGKTASRIDGLVKACHGRYK